MATSATAPVVPARPAVAIDASFLDELIELAEDISYAGFDTKRIRALAVAKMDPKQLLRVLVAAAQVGNTPERLSKKVVDADVAKDLKKELKDAGIKSAGAVGVDDLTLARVASAFAPLYYALRVVIKAKLQDQNLGTGLAPEWQSPSLAVYSDLPETKGMSDWLQKFAVQIKPRGEDARVSETRALGFAQLAIGNRPRDPFLDPANLKKPVAELVKLLYSSRT